MTSQQGLWMVKYIVKQGSALTVVVISLAFTFTLTGASVMFDLMLARQIRAYSLTNQFF